MFNETQTVDIRSIRTIPEEVRPADEERFNPLRNDDDYDSCETFPWPSHEEGLRELEDDDTSQPVSAWTARIFWAAAVVLFIADAFAYFTR